MRAVVLRQFGDPKQLKIEDVPTPVPGAGEALVAVRAAGINPSDVKNVKGAMHGTTLPRIPGRDFAGVVVRGPENLVDQEVWGTGGDLGFTRDGSHAEFILLPIAAITPKPRAISMEAAGSAGVTFVTAWSAMVVAADISRGDAVVIIGAAGGVGAAAVQIAKARGARVMGCVRSADDIASVRDDGADEVIDTTSTDPIEAAKSFTGGRGAEVVFDSSGFMFAEAIEAAGIGGRIPVIAAPTDGKASFNLRNLYRKELRICGVDTRLLDAVECAKLLAQMAPGFESGEYKVKPASARPLKEVVEAYEAAGQGERVVLRPDR